MEEEIIESNEKTVISKKQSSPFTLRARGGTNPTDIGGLSRSILHAFSNNPDKFVVVESIGSIAHEVALASYRLAKEEVEKRSNGFILVVTESTYYGEIDGKKSRGISTRIFPIPIKYAL